MRINQQSKSVDMEVRDINYILPQYIRSYLFYTKNEDPERIIFPMFSSVPHPIKAGVNIPIEYVPMISPVVSEIIEDGKDIPEVTPVQEAALDEKDEEIKQLKEQLAKLEVNAKQMGTAEPQLGDERVNKDGVPELYVRAGEDIKIGGAEESPTLRPPKSKAKTAPDRAPRMPPGGDIGTGSPDNMGSRDRADLSRTKRDLLDEPETNEAEEKDFGKKIKRDEQGKPVVEE